MCRSVTCRTRIGVGAGRQHGHVEVPHGEGVALHEPAVQRASPPRPRRRTVTARRMSFSLRTSADNPLRPRIPWRFHGGAEGATAGRPQHGDEGARRAHHRDAAHGADRGDDRGGRRESRLASSPTTRCCACSPARPRSAARRPRPSTPPGAPSWPTRERAEGEVLDRYLPAQLTDDELAALVAAADRRDRREQSARHGCGDEARRSRRWPAGPTASGSATRCAVGSS